LSSPSETIAERLKAEGKFDDFKQRREELVAEGLSKGEAYARAVSEFGASEAPGLPAPPTRENRRAVLPRPKSEPSSDVFAGKKSTLRDDYQWVYENIAVSNVEPGEAPSSGAWGLLQFAQNDPKSFYVEWMRMVGKQVDENAELRGFVQDAARSTSEIASMLRSLQAPPVLSGGEEDGGGEPATAADASGEGWS
tara:strand:+ start:1299 stop:1883 length:585 start_codon:yes stop_codon:yes gene_type:complete